MRAVPLLLLLLFFENAHAQTDSIKCIDDVVTKIKAEKNHVTREFELREVYGENSYPDGGGIVKVKSTYSEPTIIKQDFVVSRGRITTIIYLEKLKPVQIINIEEQFSRMKDGTGLDYTKLNITFKETVYILDWNDYATKSFHEGERSLTKEQNKAEYDKLIESVKELVVK